MSFIGREKLGVGSHESVKAVLETDGTQVDDTEYFGKVILCFLLI